MIFTQPVPSSGLAQTSATSGISRFKQRQPHLAAVAGHAGERFQLAAASCGGAPGDRRSASEGPASPCAGRVQPGLELGLGLIQRGGRIRVHRHGRIAQHRLRPRGGQGHVLWLAGLGIDDGIVEIPEIARHGLVEDLVVADGRLQHGVPVHQPLAAIDQSVAEHLEERMPHRPGALRIEGEAGPLPVAAAAHFLELAEDPLFVVVLPLPDAGHEPFAAELVAAELFLLQQAAFDHGLRGDARMIGARHPQGFEALHPLLADEDVLQGVVQGVAQVQGAGDVGRRDDDRVGLLAGFGSLWKKPWIPSRRTSDLGRRKGCIVWGGRAWGFKVQKFRSSIRLPIPAGSVSFSH